MLEELHIRKICGEYVLSESIHTAVISRMKEETNSYTNILSLLDDVEIAIAYFLKENIISEDSTFYYSGLYPEEVRHLMKKFKEHKILPIYAKNYQANTC